MMVANDGWWWFLWGRRCCVAGGAPSPCWPPPWSRWTRSSCTRGAGSNKQYANIEEEKTTLYVVFTESYQLSIRVIYFGCRHHCLLLWILARLVSFYKNQAAFPDKISLKSLDKNNQSRVWIRHTATVLLVFSLYLKLNFLYYLCERLCLSKVLFSSERKQRNKHTKGPCPLKTFRNSNATYRLSESEVITAETWWIDVTSSHETTIRHFNPYGTPPNDTST